MNVEYIVANPTGNITVLVTTPVPEEERLGVVKDMFAKTPTCEQVGFVAVRPDSRISLEMMGGEFCGNATISAAAYLASINDLKPGCKTVMTVDASGVEEAVPVIIKCNEEGSYTGALEMPLPCMAYYDGCPVVNFDGISHMIIPAGSATAEELEGEIKNLAKEMNVSALGIIQYEEDEEGVTIVPLVYVRESNTLVWEQGCASGSIAAAYYRFAQDNEKKTTNVLQPGGIMNIEIRENSAILTGNVVFEGCR